MRPIALLFAAAFFQAACLSPARADDGRGNHYRVRIDAAARVAHVEADAWFPGPSLAMFGVQSSLQMPDGQAQLLRDLRYGGGALAAFALDVRLRTDSGGRVGLPELLRRLYAEFGKPGATYTLADVERHASALTGRDYRTFMAGLVESRGFHDARPTFADVGLELEAWLHDEAYVRADPAAAADTVARHEAIFGGSP